ncbi:MAG: hypothetical protein BWY89_01011 [Bacteroidetes bacterium ADurb.BinA012]|nr:MAG: hypothetical protein BWY89_01011 [Bacteroidetes bacterium ADurb.BinA012]
MVHADRNTGDLTQPVSTTSQVNKPGNISHVLPVLVSIEKRHLPGNGLDSGVGIVFNDRLYILSYTFGGDNDNTVGAPGTIDCCSRAILKHVN